MAKLNVKRLVAISVVLALGGVWILSYFVQYWVVLPMKQARLLVTDGAINVSWTKDVLGRTDNRAERHDILGVRWELRYGIKDVEAWYVPGKGAYPHSLHGFPLDPPLGAVWRPASYMVEVLVRVPFWTILGFAFGYRCLTAIRRSLRDYRKPSHPSCTKCKYNLTGNLSGTCPECGTRVTKPPDLASPTAS